MIKLLLKIPRKVTLAVSGGVDSMALLDFTRRNHEVTVAFFHHGTENSKTAHEFISGFCKSQNLDLVVGHITKDRERGLSMEEHWRNERYKFLDQFECVATGHNLNDCVETWIWSCLHGTPKLIPSTRGNVMRPLLATPKSELYRWCKKNNVPWVEDKSNADINYTRNFIRHKMMSDILQVNPGIHKMIQRKIIERENVLQ